MPLYHAVSSQNALESHGSQHTACYCGPPAVPTQARCPPQAACAARDACMHRHCTPLGSFGHERRHTEPERTCRDLGLKQKHGTQHPKSCHAFTEFARGCTMGVGCACDVTPVVRPTADRWPRAHRVACSVACFWLAFELAIYMSRSECV